MSNTLMVTRDMVLEDLRQERELSYGRRVWLAVGAWLDWVRDYLRDTPEIGEAEAILFSMRREPALPVQQHDWRPLPALEQ